MNIAIIVGVSDYINETKLPACKRDAELISELLVATGKYTEVLLLNENTTISSLKENLRAFFSKYSGKDIEEAFFYFSGHGSYHSTLEDVLLCSSNFDSKKPGFTSLSNSDIDNLLRSVNPKVAVKVYDACNAGAQYIKDLDAGDKFDKALRVSQLNAFHFMASSRLDQSSYADKEGSHFTIKFIEGALANESGQTMYRDIQAFVADSFVNKKEQTPFFVSQGTGLEVFSTVTSQMISLRNKRNGYLDETEKSSDTRIVEPELKKQIDQIVTIKDAAFVSENEVISFLESSKEKLTKEKIKDPLVKNYYKLDINFDGKVESLPNAKSIAEWLHTQKSHSLFTKISFSTVERPMTVTEYMTKSLTAHRYVNETVKSTVQESVPTSVSTTRPLPYETIHITLQPANHRALKPFGAIFALLHSRLELVILSSTVSLKEIGWDEYAVNPASIKWKQNMLTWKAISDSPELIWRELLLNLEETARLFLEGLVPKKDEPVAPPHLNPATASKEKPSSSSPKS